MDIGWRSRRARRAEHSAAQKAQPHANARDREEQGECAAQPYPVHAMRKIRSPGRGQNGGRDEGCNADQVGVAERTDGPARLSQTTQDEADRSALMQGRF